jgi:ribonuclease VapC
VLTARLGPNGVGLLARFLREFLVEVIPFGDAHWREAAEAYLRYGRARHPAGLNFGDCLTYATCRLADRPLLYVGDDFTQTDIEGA